MKTKRESRKSWAVLGGLALLATLFLGCSDAIGDAAGIPIPPEAHRRQAAGELVPGDVIGVTFPEASELNLTQRIRADGRISLPRIGDVRAGGKSLPSFQSELQGRYKASLQDPKVVVSLVSAASAVYVSGAVGRPGKIPLDRPMTVLEAVMEAGGLSPAANARKVSVIRTDGGSHRRYNLDLTGAFGGGEAFYVKPYDVIYVGQRKW